MDKKAIALLANDIHASKENLSEFRLNWEEMLTVAEDYGVKDILIGGDLFTTRASQSLDVLLAIHDALVKAALSYDITVANGNHDKVDQKNDRGYCHIFYDIKRVYIVDDVEVINYGNPKESPNISVTMIGYYPENDGFLEKLNKAEELVQEMQCKHFLFIHQGINGALRTPSDSDLSPNVFGPVWDKVFVGHYHDRCVIEGTNIEYIGASRQHNYGEDDQKGYTILFSDGSTEFVQNKVNTRYVTVEANYEQVMSDDFRSCLEGASNSNVKIKLKVSCDPSQITSINREELSAFGVAKIEINQPSANTTSETQRGLVERYDKSGLIESYKNYCTENKVQDVDFGVGYLNKINMYVVG